MGAIGGVKTLVVKDGCEKEFEKLFFEMLSHIKAEEKECVYYDLYKSRTIVRGYTVLERYATKDAWQRHQDSEYGKTYFPQIRALLESISVEYFDDASSTSS